MRGKVQPPPTQSAEALCSFCMLETSIIANCWIHKIKSVHKPITVMSLNIGGGGVVPPPPPTKKLGGGGFGPPPPIQNIGGGGSAPPVPTPLFMLFDRSPSMLEDAGWELGGGRGERGIGQRCGPSPSPRTTFLFELVRMHVWCKLNLIITHDCNHPLPNHTLPI